MRRKINDDYDKRSVWRRENILQKEIKNRMIDDSEELGFMVRNIKH